MKIYMSEGGALIVLLVYVPIALVAVLFLWKSLPRAFPIRLSVTLAVAAGLACIPLWDVLITSYQMAGLCATAGLRVYKTVQASGYLTNFGHGEEVLKNGFSYVEIKRGPKELIVYTAKANEGLTKQVVDPSGPYVPRSRYEYVYGSIQPDVNSLNMAASRNIVRDRNTGEILGEATSYTAFPGWVDRNTVQRFGNMAWSCHKEATTRDDLLRRTLLPLAD